MGGRERDCVCTCIKTSSLFPEKIKINDLQKLKGNINPPSRLYSEKSSAVIERVTRQQTESYMFFL